MRKQFLFALFTFVAFTGIAVILCGSFFMLGSMDVQAQQRILYSPAVTTSDVEFTDTSAFDPFANELAEKPVPALAKDPRKMSLEELEAIALQPALVNPITGSRVVPEMLPLFKEESIRYTGKAKYRNTLLKYRLYVPENMEAGKKYPLIFWMHGVGEAGNDNKLQLIHLHHLITYFAGPQKRDFFLLVPQAPQDHAGWDAYSHYTTRVVNNQVIQDETGEAFEDSPLGFSFAMIDQAIAKYPVDTDRITVSGLSSGGDGTWRALERRPDLFAAAVPLVSWSALRDKDIQKSPILKKIPIWAIYSSDDNGIESAREDFDRVEKAGCNVKKSEFGLCGHNAWTPAMLQADIFSWLLTRAKKDGEYIAVDVPNVDPDAMKGIVEVATRSAMYPTVAPKPEEAAETPVVVGMTEAKPENVLISKPPQGVVVSPPQIVVNPQRIQIASDAPLVTPGPEVWERIQARRELIKQKENLQAMIALRYLSSEKMEDFVRVYKKLSSEQQIQVLNNALQIVQPKQLEVIEKLLDEFDPSQAAIPEERDMQGIGAIILQRNMLQGQENPDMVLISPTTESDSGLKQGQVLVEECDKVWEMSTDTVYGLFAADWQEEDKNVPAFVKRSTVEQFGIILDEAIAEKGKTYEQICQSITKLESRPLSSPWFETSGGRLRSDIKYTLSSKGKLLYEKLKQSNDPLARRALEKMDAILGQ